MSSGVFRGKESSNRIELSRLVQDLNFGVLGSLQLWGRSRWVGRYLEAWGYLNTHAHACMHMYTCVMAVGSSTVWISEYVHGVHRTLTSCQQNPILFGQAGLTTPTRLGFLFWLTFPVTPWHNGNYDSNTKCKGCLHASDETVPGEHTVGQTQLTVQLAVGSQRKASRFGRDL